MASVGELLRGKVVLVTGATSGIGEQTARALAGRGATVVVNGRDPDRCQATIRRIQEEFDGAAVEPLVGDLSNRDGVRGVGEAFRARHDRLDVLVNNAGAMFWNRQETSDGLERTFALNHLSYFQLTNLLLDVLKASAPSRVVSVSSALHRSAQLDFDDLHAKKSYSAMRVYGQSKLANVLFTYELARRLEGSGVTANCLHPGVTATNFGKGRGMTATALWLFTRFVQGAEQGARTSVYLATSPDVERVSGKYFEKKKPVASSPLSHDEATARRLWDVSVALTV